MKDIKIIRRNDGGLRVELADFLPLEIQLPQPNGEEITWRGSLEECQESHSEAVQAAEGEQQT